jgi:hypothetical protein
MNERKVYEYNKTEDILNMKNNNLHSWYHKWNDGNNPVMWLIRTTLLKLDNMGLIRLKIGQIFTFRDLFKSVG